MTGPFAAAGIDLQGYRMTKKLLKKFTAEGRPHTVALHTMGGIYTSKGDGVYESTMYRWESVNDFWRHIARHSQGRGIVWESE